MKPFKGYEETQTNEFAQSLKVGGHYCKILDVEEQSFKTKDNKTYSKFKVKIDICEPDEQKGFYEKKYKEDAIKDAMTAKWKGYFDVSIPNDTSEDFIKRQFKTFITSVEKSNPGYDWIKSNWDEKTLVGKIFVGVFGLEEFTLPTNGNVITFCRCRDARSIESINKIPIPRVKLLDGTYKDYEEYMTERKNNNNDNSNATTSNSNDSSIFSDTDDLPF